MGVVYLVYLARFVSLLGVVRVYVGHTRSLDVRMTWHKKRPPAWMRARSKKAKDAIQYKILEEGIPTKEMALALEALHAARAVAAEPDLARGGPWSKPTLPDDWRAEVYSAACCNSLMAMKAVAKAHPSGRLWAHLQDLSFEPAADAPAGVETARGAYVTRKRKSGRSGCTGYASRKRRLELSATSPDHLRKGTAHYRRLQRGIDAKERRNQENSRCQAKRAQTRKSRAMKSMRRM